MQGPYVSVRVSGGLGNQLFNIAAAFALKAIVPEVTVVFAENEDRLGRPKSWDGFLADCPEVQAARVSKLPDGDWRYLGDYRTAFVFINYRGEVRRNVRNGISTHITGCLQNNRFLPERPLTLRLFNIEVKHQLLRERFPNIDFTTTCSLHFRLGDYKALSHIHILLPNEYYQSAIGTVLAERPMIKKILVFNELDDQIQVETRMAAINADKQLELQYASAFGLRDWEEMVLMSLCLSNIIANSTFSWWSGFFNTNPGAFTVYPLKWINQADSNHIDIAQPGWKGL